MRVLLIAGEFPPMQGGVGAFSRCLARELGRQGCRVTVFAPEEAATPDEEYALLPAARGWGWRDLWRLRAACAGADVVNLQYQAAAYGMRLPVHLLPHVCRAAGTPLVTTFHDLRLPYLFPKAGPLRARAVRRLLEGSNAAIVTNEEDAAAAPAMAPAARLSLVRIGSNVEPAPYSPASRQALRRAWGCDEATTVVCYFGFLNETKGAGDLVRAVALLRDRGEDVRLVFIGGQVGASDASNRAYRQRVLAAIAEAGIEERVAHTGFVEDAAVSAAFYAADVSALPFRDGASYRRGSLMAALAHGMATVTTRPAVAIAGLCDGDNVVLVPPGDAEALARALGSLAHDPALRARLRLGARALADGFGWPAIARDTIAVYERTVTVSRQDAKAQRAMER